MCLVVQFKNLWLWCLLVVAEKKKNDPVGASHPTKNLIELKYHMQGAWFTEVISSFCRPKTPWKNLEKGSQHSFICVFRYVRPLNRAQFEEGKKCFHTVLTSWHSSSALFPVLLSTWVLPGSAHNRDDPPHSHWSGPTLSGLHWQP